MNKIICFVFLLLFVYNVKAQTLEEQARVKITELNSLITEAQSEGIDVLKEQMTVRTAEVFLDYANWDESNISMNTDLFAMVNRYQDNASEIGESLSG